VGVSSKPSTHYLKTRFVRNEDPKENSGSAFGEAKLNTFQKKRRPEETRGSAFLEEKLNTLQKK
jgi:hypothetical protein